MPKMMKYPIDRSRKGGAKPRKMDVSLGKRPVAEKSGSIIEKPKEKSQMINAGLSEFSQRK